MCISENYFHATWLSRKYTCYHLFNFFLLQKLWEIQRFKVYGVFGTPCIIYTVVVQTFSEPSLSACGVQTSIDSTVLKDFTECNLSWTRYVIREVQDTVHDFINLLLLTARRYASAVYAVVVCPCVSLSVCLTQAGIVSKPLNIERHMISPGNLVFWSQRYPRNSTSVKPYGGAKCSWGRVGQNRRLSTDNWLYLKNGTR